MKRISTVSRTTVFIAALAMTATYFLPVWAIYLVAPQYPEGLEMNIWLSKITGQVEIINGLNHYIGMKKINADMFPEFTFLPFLMGFFILSGLVVAVTGRRNLLGAYCLLLILFAVAALVDFYVWGYDYGHNLDPTAPIQVPGLSYQPPIIGHKKLLNFDAYSYPDTGAWIVIGAAVLCMLTWFLEWRKMRSARYTPRLKKTAPVVSFGLLLLVAGCTPTAEKIVYGKDACTDCKMTIVDVKFGGEILSRKGKVFKFDDVHCMVSFLKQGTLDKEEIHQTLITVYNSGGERFVNSDDAHFVVSSSLKSPMGSNAASYASEAEAGKVAAETGGKRSNWTALFNSLAQ